MLPKKKIAGLVEYWVKSSEHDLQTVHALYKLKQYSECLFWAHLLLEKVLKALVVKKTKEYALKIHNLRRLAEIADLNLEEKELDLLSETNIFNMRARYPDEKLAFYKKCTKAYTDHYYQPIITLYKKLCRLSK